MYGKFRWRGLQQSQSLSRAGARAAHSTDCTVPVRLYLHLRRIGNPRQLSLVINQIPGVVENGLFIDICDVVVIGHGTGKVEVRDINSGDTEEDRLDFVESDNMFSDLND